MKSGMPVQIASEVLESKVNVGSSIPNPSPFQVPRRRRSLYATSAAVFRWVHVYVSMLGFTMLMFFGFTGMTLNHPTWFGASEQRTKDLQGDLPEELAKVVRPTASPESSDEATAANERFDKLAIAEFLRAEHRLKGAVKEFEVDDYECMIVFKGPGYSADIFVDREKGSYTVTETTTGLVSVLNDLHKGRDSGTEWAVLIDVSAIITMLLSASGFGLLLYLKRRRLSGTMTAVAGTALLIAVWWIWVP
jgi:hypothetical protein